MNTVLEKPEFKTWKKIKLGTGLKTSSDFKQAINSTGMWIDMAGDAFHGIDDTVADCEIEVELVIVSVAELCFDQQTTINDIYVRAQDIGLGICSAEVGPQLRLQYKDQAKGEGLVVATKIVHDGWGEPSLFYICCSGDQSWIEILSAKSEMRWSTKDRFVFLQKK